MDVSKLLSVYKKASDNEKNKVRTQSIGALAKKRRIYLHMTQGEVAEKICSVSYLSKVETNKIIPNERCITALMERVKISKWEIYTIENSKELIDNAITYFLYNNMVKYREIFDRVYDVETNQCADVIKIGYYLLNDDISNAEKLIKDNINISSSMDKYVMSFFLYLVCLYLLKTGDYKDLESALNNEKSLYYNVDLQLLFDELSFNYFSQTKRPVEAKESYDNLIRTYKDKMVFFKIDGLVLNYALFLLREKEYYMAINELLALRRQDSMQENPLYNYILAKSYHMIGKDITAKEYLDLITPSSPYYPYIIDIKYTISNDKQKTYEEASKAMVDNPSFYLDYFLKKEAGMLSRRVFSTKEYNSLYYKADNYTKIDMLQKEKEFLIDDKKYKDAISIDKRIEKLL